MLSRFWRIALLCFQAIWLNAIVPGHTRGIVELPGVSCGGCCLTQTHHSSDPAHVPVGDPAHGCAICYFAACLSSAPAVDFTPPKLGLLLRLPGELTPAPATVSPVVTYLGRAPPSMA